MPIRIMHVVNNLGKGGLENGLVNLIQSMDSNRFEHVVCTLRGLGPNLERLPTERVEVLTLADPGSPTRFQTPALAKAIRHHKPDIVHSRNWAAIEAVVASRLARAGAVVHSEHGFEASATLGEPWRKAWFRRVAFELADRVFAVSWQLRDIHATGTGFSAERIGVIHNGVDCRRFSADVATRNRVRAELKIDDSELCIGCVANLLPVKDHMTLLTAIGLLARQRENWRLLLVGEGSEEPRLRAFVEQDPLLRERVTFTGSSNRVVELLRAMDVFVLPSVAEGICNSLLEAMASGVAVVATAVGGNPEIIVDGESGLLFPVGDAGALAEHLLHLEGQPAMRKQLAERAIQRVREEFSLQSMVQQYEQLYSSLRPTGIPVLSAG
jgi:sugar transferase (PEP-CTERM/EpsH1 system associated)